MREVIVYDNKGRSLDRYTVFIQDTVKVDGKRVYDVFSMSDNPGHPCGVHLWVANRIPMDKYSKKRLGKVIQFESLPDEVKKAINNLLEV